MLVIFQHFTLVRFGGYDLTVLLVLLPVWMLNCVELPKRFSLNSLLWYGFFLLYPLINFYTFHSVAEFLKTYLQFVLCITFFLLLYNSRPIINRDVLLKAIVSLQYILTIFLVTQYIVVIFLHQDWFYNPWGMFSWKYPLPREEYNFYRMKGFFLEPSYVAFVVFTLLTCRYLLERRLSWKNLLLACIALIMINSSFGILSFVVIVTMMTVLRFKGKQRIIFIITASVLLLVLAPFFLENFFRLTKLDNLNAESYNSAYTRWIFPMNMVIHIFSSGFYTGFGMGQLDPIINDFDLIIIQSEESGISNSLALILIYFGFSAILILGYLFYRFFKGPDAAKVLIVYLLICLANTGAFNTIEFFFTAFMLPYICFKLGSHEVKYNNGVL